MALIAKFNRKAASLFGMLRRYVIAYQTRALFATTAANNFLRLASNLMLTRILAPDAFGAAGVFISVSQIFALISDLGVNAFIVRSREGEDPRFLNVVWSIRFARSVVLTVSMFSLAKPIAEAYSAPELTDALRVSSLLFLLEGMKSLHPIVAERQRRVAYVSTVETISLAIQILATVITAYIFRSYWGLLYGLFIGGAIGVIFSYRLYPGGLHHFAFEAETARELWGFARIVIPSSVITLILMQADKILISRTLSIESFGLYILATNISMAGSQLVNAWSQRVLYPKFAEVERRAPASLRSEFYQSRIRVSSFLAFAFGFALGAGEFLARTLFDDRYLGVGLFLSIMFISPLALLIARPAESVVIARGRIQSAFEANLVRLAWIALSAPAMLHYVGVVGVALAFALVEAAAAVYWWLRLWRSGLLNVKIELIFVGAGLIGIALGFAANAGVNAALRSGALPPF